MINGRVMIVIGRVRSCMYRSEECSAGDRCSDAGIFIGKSL